jgi:hypothetical protein
MADQPNQSLSLFNQRGTLVGTIRVSSEEDSWVLGEFSPSEGFDEYASIFTALEHASNEMLLVECDALEKEIHRLGFCVSEPGRAATKIADLQIMDGGISFRWNDPGA